MKLVRHANTHPLRRDTQTYTLTISRLDLLRANLTAADRRLIREAQAQKTSIADKLLALELVARRIEEAA